MRWNNSMRTLSASELDGEPRELATFDDLLAELAYLRRAIPKASSSKPPSEDDWATFWAGIIGAKELPLGGNSIGDHASAMLFAHAHVATASVRGLLQSRVAQALKRLRAARSLVLYEAGSPTGVLVGHTMRTRYIELLGYGAIHISWVVPIPL